MQSIEWIPLSKKAKWDLVVRGFNNADIYYKHGYAKSFSRITEGEPFLLYFDNGSFKACNVVILRLIPETEYYDLTSVYGYGGWIFEGATRAQYLLDLFSEYQNSCIERKIVSEVIRTHPNASRVELLEVSYTRCEIGSIVNVDLQCEDLWQQIPSKSRNVIRKAEKLGVEIKFGDSSLISAERFKEIYDATMARANAAAFYFFPLDFHKEFSELMADEFSYFTAELDGNLLCAAIITHTNGMMNYHLSGTSDSARGIPAMNLLLYTAMKFGAKNGYKSFNLGGGVGAKEDSLFKFKKSFSKSEPRSFSLLTKVFDKSIYHLLEQARINSNDAILQDDFFPKYRAPIVSQ